MGGINLRAAEVDADGNIFQLLSEPTEAEKGWRYTLHKLTEMIKMISGSESVPPPLRSEKRHYTKPAESSRLG